MTVATPYANPYWDAVREHVTVERRLSWEPMASYVGGLDKMALWGRRTELVSQYAWTITDPATVAFVAEHAGSRVIDPLAGSGYWAWLLGQHGADVAASDVAPPDSVENHYHKTGIVHVPVAQRDAVDAVAALGDERTLLLAWPPYSEPIGALAIRAYPGDRIVFIGEGAGGCCGDDDMWTALADGWVQNAEHRPVQWWGLHDWVTVYERRAEP